MPLRLPLYLKTVIILIGLTVLIYLLTLFKALLVPLVFAMLFSFLMLPTCRMLERARIPRPFAILICLLLIMVVVAAIVWFISAQMLEFRQELAGIGENLQKLVERMQIFLEEKFGFEISDNGQFVRDQLSNLGSTGGSVVTSTISFTTDMLTFLSLLPIYFFCMLYYRDQMRRFMFQYVNAQQRGAFMSVVDDMRKVVQNYISGLAIVILIVAMLNSAGLMMLGVKYALFFGVTASILMIIPYIGILIGSLFPAIYVLVTTGSLGTALGVVGVMAVVQFLEGNFITPYIVGSKLRLNAFAAILALVVGGHVWGAPGMILAIPLLAILKVAFDHYQPMKPFGLLLSDLSEQEEENMFSGIMRKVHNLFTKEENPDKPNGPGTPR